MQSELICAAVVIGPSQPSAVLVRIDRQQHLLNHSFSVADGGQRSA